MPPTKKNNGPWTKITQAALPIMFTALLMVIAFLGQQIFALKGEIARCELEDVKRDLEIRGKLALYELTVSNLSSKIDKLELALEEERNEENSVLDDSGSASDHFGFDPFLVDDGTAPDEDR